MSRLTVLVLASLVACGEDAPAERPKIPVVTGPIVEHADAAAGTAYGSAAFPCCDSDAATGLVGAFVGLGEALAADDADKAQERVSALSGAVATATTSAGVDDAARADLEKMAALADRMRGKDLDSVREEFLDLSDPMLGYARAHRKDGAPLTVAVAFCPMKPGRWLQAADGIKNPYYGAEMLTCGVFEAP
jgi:hypothetical protein